MQSRLPRFKRTAQVAPMQLTDRDRAVIRLVHQHRFLRSSHIVALLGDGFQQLLRRLQLLYHHGFLERPRAQIDYYHSGGSRHMVYGLGNRGATLLNQELGSSCPSPRWGEKNRAAGRLFLEHALLVSDVMVALELGCRKVSGVSLLTGDDLPWKGEAPHRFKWNVKLPGGQKLGLIPDRVFALESEEESPDRSPAFFFLEADRGTMPIVRNNLSQTSFYRKLLAYEATWAQGVHRSQFGFHRFRVLTVTTSAARVKSLVDASSQLKSGHGLFLFTDRATLEGHGDIFTLPWKTGRQGETTSLLN
jgi:Replication-relaxation